MKTIIVISLLLTLAYSRTFYVETKNVLAKSQGSGEDFANNIRNDISAAEQPNGYCTVNEPTMPITNSGLCGGPTENIGFHYELSWSSYNAQSFNFDMGFDFGWGGAINFNGEWIHIDNSDVWWGGSDWNNADVWHVTLAAPEGGNVMHIYGSEGCCDGANDIRYQITDSVLGEDGATWYSINDWQESVQPPQPATRVWRVDTVNVQAKSEGSGEDFAENVKSDVLNAPQPNGYCSVEDPVMPFTNQGLCGGPAENIGFHFELSWYSYNAQSFNFDMGFDFGWGGAIELNEEWIHIDNSDVWWGGSDWNNADVWHISFDVTEGWNSMHIYGHEGCCDGANDIRYQITDSQLGEDGTTWYSINDWQESEESTGGSVSTEECVPCKSINKVCNPSFEEPAIGNGSWTPISEIPYWQPTEQKIEIWNNLMGAARHGDQHLELRPDIPEGVKQTINGLESGMVYQINFAASCRPGYDTNVFRVWFDGVQIGQDVSIGNEGQIIWHDQDGLFFFTTDFADGHQLIIEDPSPNGNANSLGTLLDYVSIAPCSCPAGIQNAEEHDMDTDACEKVHYNECTQECYYVDEWYNDEGSHQCSNTCQCDGFRTCNSQGWCEGEARPADSDCDIPDPGHNIVYDNSGNQVCDVVTFYSECDYQGDVVEIDDHVDCLDFPPKSICLPRGKSVTVWDLCEFNGMEATFETNIMCIQNIDFDLLMDYGITLSGKKNNLKTNAKPATSWKFEVKDL